MKGELEVKPELSIQETIKVTLYLTKYPPASHRKFVEAMVGGYHCLIGLRGESEDVTEPTIILKGWKTYDNAVRTLNKLLGFTLSQAQLDRSNLRHEETES